MINRMAQRCSERLREIRKCGPSWARWWSVCVEWLNKVSDEGFGWADIEWSSRFAPWGWLAGWLARLALLGFTEMSGAR